MLLLPITCRFGFTIVPKKISIRKYEITAPLPQTIVLNIQTVALFFLIPVLLACMPLVCLTIIKVNDNHHYYLRQSVLLLIYGFFIGYLNNQSEAPMSIGASLFTPIYDYYKSEKPFCKKGSHLLIFLISYRRCKLSVISSINSPILFR